MTGLRAFREAYLSADLIADETNFGDIAARRMRYTLYWSYYENSAYRTLIHKWSHAYKTQYGLYKHIRSIYNPAYRLGEFWKDHVWGGRLDTEAGDGRFTETALPIITDYENLRSAVATLWRDSNWQVRKDTCALWGAVLGDVAIKIIDDPDREKVYCKVVHPGTIKSVDLDAFGNVKGYTIEEERIEPSTGRTMTYTEEATRDGVNVVYKTYLNGKPYAPEGKDAVWAEAYGFIPLVLIQHNDVGLEWGWSEYHSAHSKFREVDDIASKLSDQIRKMVDSPWLLAGVTKPKKELPVAGTTDNVGTNHETGREEIPLFFAPTGATATPLVTPLDITASTAHIEKILKILEQDYPELSLDMHNITGDISGRALRIHQQPAANKVNQRRPNYDDALVRAQQMAVAIGGYRGYVGYDGFDLDSYGAGLLDHQIGERPVFSKDPIDDLENEKVFWETAKMAKENGIPILVFLKQHGWTDERIAEVTKDPEYQARIASMQMASMLGDGQSETGDETPDETTEDVL